MLSSDVPATPRPRPPAKMRRSASLYSRPKPRALDNVNTSVPQFKSPDTSDSTASFDASCNTKRNSMSSAPSLPSLLGSPLSATSQVLHVNNRNGRPSEGLAVMPEIQEWFNEKSREELEELVQKVESVIKERESELDITSAVCKTLRDSNNELMQKHDVLVSRLPSLSSASRPASPTPSVSGGTKPLGSPSNSPHEHSLTWSPKISKQAMRRHCSRRISTTPSVLAFLSDQNAELQSKLQDLETDAARAEGAGRRRLRGLEREIQGLKEELDRTRTASERLEAKMLGPDGNIVGEGELDADLLKLWKKLNREAKVRELRAKTRPWEDSEDESLKDFAPGSNLARSTNDRHLLMSSSLRARTPSKRRDVVGDDELLREVEPPAQVPTPPLSPLPHTGNGAGTRGERAIVSQLLLKIRELEETNTALANQQLEARVRLRRAEEETENMRRLYEMINADIGQGGLELEMEMVDVPEIDGEGVEGQEMGLGLSEVGTPRRKLRFRSVGKRSVRSFGKSLGSNPFGFDVNSHSSLRRDPFAIPGSSEHDPWNTGYVDADADIENLDGKSASDFSAEFFANGSVKKPRKPLRGLFDGLSSSVSATRSQSFKATKLMAPVVFPASHDALTLEDLRLNVPNILTSNTPKSDITSELPSYVEDFCTNDISSLNMSSPVRTDAAFPTSLASELASQGDNCELLASLGSNSPAPNTCMRTLGDELSDGVGLTLPTWNARPGGMDHMRSRSIHDLLSKVEADVEGVPTVPAVQAAEKLAPPAPKSSQAGSLKKMNSRLSFGNASANPVESTQVVGPDEDKEEEIFHDAPEFGSFKLKNRKHMHPTILDNSTTRSNSSPASSLRGIPIFSVDDLSIRPRGTFNRHSARRRVQSEASRPPPRPRFMDLLNVWAWLQLLLSIAVLFVMAARLGPKAVVNRRMNAA